MSFADLKRNSKSLTAKLNAELAKQNTSYSKDERYWQPSVDKNGNGTATIRFLPPPPGEEVPYVQIFSHSFKGPTGLWYIENSRTTMKEDDPVGELNSKLWNEVDDDDAPGRKQARKQKRNLKFISNILVLADPEKPECVGKTFLYGYGKKIFNKINEKMNPEFDDETEMNPFDFWEGADFRLRIRKVEGYRNYDKSSFDEPSPLFGNDDPEDEKKAALWEKLPSLQAEVGPDKFKDYDTLKKHLNKVLLLDTTASVTTRTEKAESLKEKVSKPKKEKSPEKLPEIDGSDDEEVDDFLKTVLND